MNPRLRLPRPVAACLASVAVLAPLSAEDSFEPDNQWGTGAILWPGLPQQRSIHTVGDVDWAGFTLLRPCHVVIQTSGPAGDTVLALHDGTGAEIAFNDDISAPENRFSRIERDCATGPVGPGVFEVRVAAFGDTEVIPEYQLEIQISSCEPRIIHVDDDAPLDSAPGVPNVGDPSADGTPEHPYDSITTAIIYSMDGDTILVAPGVYSGWGNYDIDFSIGLPAGSREITLLAEAGPEVTVIDCDGESRGFHFHRAESPDTIVDGFTITGAAAIGISCIGNAAPTIRNCVLNGNTGHAIYLNDAGLVTISGCRIEDNTGTYFSPGIWCVDTPATISDCVIASNHGGQHGAGIVFEDNFSGNPLLIRCRITGNSSTANGGGITCIWSNPVVENCIIAGNFCATRGGGVHLETHSGGSWLNSNIVANESGDGGAGVFLMDSSTPVFANCIIARNGPAELRIDPSTGSSPELFHCLIPGGWSGAGANNLDADPGLLYLGGRIEAPFRFWVLAPGSPCIDAGMSFGLPATDMHGRPRYDDPAVPNEGDGAVPFTDIGAHEFSPWFVDASTGDDANDGRHPQPAAGGHGPLRTIQEALDSAAGGDLVRVAPGTYSGPGNRDLDFLGKQVVVRAAAGLERTRIDCGGSPGDPHRAAHFHRGEGPAAVLDGFTIRGADAIALGPGGGLLVEDASPTVVGCRVTGCRAENGGGIALVRSGSQIVDCVLEHNSADGSPPGPADGGAIDTREGFPLIRNCLLVSNHAAGFGGAVHASGGMLRVSHCTLAANSAGNAGGFHVAADSFVDHSILWDNVAGSIVHSSAALEVTHSNVDGGSGQPWFRTGCIDLPPLFTSGPRHRFYLSHLDLQGVHSPCVDSGSAPAAELGFLPLTTRTDSGPDIDMIDMGYHAPHFLRIIGVFFAGDDVIVEWNGHPGGSYTVHWSTDLADWQPVFVGGVNSWTDIGGRLRPATFYRVVAR